MNSAFTITTRPEYPVPKALRVLWVSMLATVVLANTELMPSKFVGQQ